MSCRTRFLTPGKIVLILVLATANPLAAAADCLGLPSSLQAAAITASSKWSESNALHELVRESGTMSGSELSVGWRCNDWAVNAELAQVNGSRLYEGQTSAGLSAISHSAVRQRQINLDAGLAISEAWQLGARFSRNALWRDIASTESASGYPEHFEWSILSLGAEWQSAMGPGQLTLAAWVGGGMQSRMTLNLPGRDPALLSLGSLRQIEVVARWATELAPSWTLAADVRYRRTDIDQGEDAVISRGRQPVGVAHQPRTRMTEHPLMIRIGYVF
jgi:hypothetical protein